MPINNSIIIYLDNILKLYRSGVVKLKINENTEILDLVELAALGEENGILNLADKFEILWERIEPEFGGLPVFFIVGPRARFTDTRIVFTWLKTKAMFEPGFEFYIAKNNKPLSDLDSQELYHLLLEIKASNSKDLQYSKEPNIGRN